jgi:hypothetical protein
VRDPFLLREAAREILDGMRVISFFAGVEILLVASLASPLFAGKGYLPPGSSAAFSVLSLVLAGALLLAAWYKGVTTRGRGGWLRWCPHRLCGGAAPTSTGSMALRLTYYAAYLMFAALYSWALFVYAAAVVGSHIAIVLDYIGTVVSPSVGVISRVSLAYTLALAALSTYIVVFNIIAAALERL